MHYNKPNLFCYRLAQAASNIVARLVFKRKILRNEIKDVKGPYLVIANHQAAYDFVNLMGVTKRTMSFVISNSFYQSLPIKGFLDKLGVIPKQQFQTTVNDMKKIKATIDAGQPVVIYPAGLMCEDGLFNPVIDIFLLYDAVAEGWMLFMAVFCQTIVQCKCLLLFVRVF